MSQDSNYSNPVVVGAVGGSGTRILSRILSQARVHMGSSVDPRTWDSLPIREYLGTDFLQLATACLAEEDDYPPASRERFLDAIRKHREAIINGSRWGWKNPRNMWLIPFLARLFPQMFFVLLVRDGRDVALSTNKFLLRSAGHRLLGGETYPSDAMAQLALWERGMRFAMKSGPSLLGNQFIVIRYEDLCTHPIGTLEYLFDSLKIHCNKDLLSQLSESIKPSPGIGRGISISMQMIPPSTKELLATLRYSVEP